MKLSTVLGWAGVLLMVAAGFMYFTEKNSNPLDHIGFHIPAQMKFAQGAEPTIEIGIENRLQSDIRIVGLTWC